MAAAGQSGRRERNASLGVGEVCAGGVALVSVCFHTKGRLTSAMQAATGDTSLGRERPGFVLNPGLSSCARLRPFG